MMRDFYRLCMITGFITHIWTVIIAFQESGIIACIISLLLPFLSEVYWVITMFGKNNLYVFIAVIHLILSIPAFGNYRQGRG